MRRPTPRREESSADARAAQVHSASPSQPPQAPTPSAAKADGDEPRDPDEPWRTPRWSRGEPVPPGYHLEVRRRLWPFLVGVPIAAAGYAFAVSLAQDRSGGSGWGFVPVVGPLVWVGSQKSGDAGYDLLVDYVDVLCAALQAGGIALVTFGLVGRQTALVANDSSRIRVLPAPILSGNVRGVGLVGAF